MACMQEESSKFILRWWRCGRASPSFFSSGVKVLQNYDPKKKIALSARTVRSA